MTRDNKSLYAILAAFAASIPERVRSRIMSALSCAIVPMMFRNACYPYSVAVEGIQAASDDAAKRAEIKRVKAAVHDRLEVGYYQGRPPFGMQFDEERRYWVPDEEFLQSLFYDVMNNKPDDRPAQIQNIDLFQNIPYLNGDPL